MTCPDALSRSFSPSASSFCVTKACSSTTKLCAPGVSTARQWACRDGITWTVDSEGVFCLLSGDATSGVNKNVILAACLGTALALALALLMWYIKKHREKARELIVSFMKKEMRLAASVAFEVLDIVSDTLVLKNVVVLRDCETGLSGLVVTWVCAYAVASLASLLNLCIKAKLFIGLYRLRRSELTLENGTKLESHRRKLNLTRLHITTILAGALLVFGESLPLGVLQVRFKTPMECKMTRSEKFDGICYAACTHEEELVPHNTD